MDTRQKTPKNYLNKMKVRSWMIKIKTFTYKNNSDFDFSG